MYSQRLSCSLWYSVLFLVLRLAFQYFRWIPVDLRDSGSQEITALLNTGKTAR